MADKEKLSTASYKGVRDFYPEDKAVLEYIFDVWKHTSESFGYEQYDASILEPAELYSAKTSEEMVNEQTYTFIDRGERRVTLRPEMTPTVARMVAGRRHDLSFPLRWYSIPNLFRYERSQRGRLREHWQLNCDIFGSNEYSADVEIIALAHQIFLNFGADESMFEIRINDRSWLHEIFGTYGLNDEQSKAMFALLDRKEKIDNFDEEAEKICGKPFDISNIKPAEDSSLTRVMNGLTELGVKNVVLSPSTVRGLTYYTGTVFEVFDTSPENNRALLGGGRYDNLTELFGGDAIPGVGFGFGDVTIRHFLETHNLLTSDITAPTLMIIPTDTSFIIQAQKIAETFRAYGVSTAVDLSARKLAKKLAHASDTFVEFVLVLGEDELKSEQYTIKQLSDHSESKGTLVELAEKISGQ